MVNVPQDALLAYLRTNTEAIVDEIVPKYRDFLEDIKSNDFLSIILRGHLYVEHELTELNSKFLIDGKFLSKNKFLQQLELGLALGAVEKEWEPALKKLNEFRNKYAHNLGFTFNEQYYEDFISTFSLEMKKNFEIKCIELTKIYGNTLHTKLGILISHLWVLLVIESRRAAIKKILLL
ncbi:hypothetical protein [Paenibacillus odorifer]|uniref:hypothetical protein n=1 Tax=Paenibacillus odorifer TaxID=189426 RepID=UPI002DB81199|nr:hypothetical protein [Paenibacillus odorifer]MEC0131516.1 hypothetical protein [Paenibacillus odorifer]MEC0220331.1 hypothetical protein [Paenibacillus odorifer]